LPNPEKGIFQANRSSGGDSSSTVIAAGPANQGRKIQAAAALYQSGTFSGRLKRAIISRKSRPQTFSVRFFPFRERPILALGPHNVSGNVATIKGSSSIKL
jgi:hypothetical protein